MDLSGIQRARKKAGLTQEALAQKLGINRATISKYESGTIDPTSGQLSAIARALGTTVHEMVGDVDYTKIDTSDSFSENPFSNESKNHTIYPNTPRVGGNGGLTLDDFTYAMQNESRFLSEEDKELLIRLARQLGEAKRKGDS